MDQHNQLLAKEKQYLFIYQIFLGFPRWLSGNICLPMQEMPVQSLGREDPLEEQTAIHSSILAWRIPWTEEPGGLHGVRKSRT